MNIAYVDEISKDDNGLKYLLVRQDLFGKTVDANGMKTNDFKKTVLSSMITKKNRPKKIWVNEGTEFSEESKKLCKLEGLHSYSTLSETKAAYAERTVESLIKIVYRYMRNYVYKGNQKMSQLVRTLNFTKMLDRFDTKNYQGFRRFVFSVQQMSTRIERTQVQKWRQSSHPEVRLAF